MRAYSVDLRARVLAACQDGMGTSEAAETFAVSEAWVRRVKQRFRDAGESAPRVARRPDRPPLGGRDAELGELVRAHPGRTAARYRELLRTTASVLSVWRGLRRLGLTHKKSRSARPSRTGPTWRRPAATGTTP